MVDRVWHKVAVTKSIYGIDEGKVIVIAKHDWKQLGFQAPNVIVLDVKNPEFPGAFLRTEHVKKFFVSKSTGWSKNDTLDDFWEKKEKALVKAWKLNQNPVAKYMENRK